MVFRVSHLTRYEYDQAVRFSPHVLYLRPRESPQHVLRRFDLQVEPAARVVTALDVQDNTVLVAHIPGPTRQLEIRTRFEFETRDRNPFDFILRRDADNFPPVYTKAERFALGPYLAPPFGPTQVGLRNWLRRELGELPGQTVAVLDTINRLIHRQVRYVRREVGGIQPSAETAKLGSGSCRDFSVLAIELLRTLGVAARFVSGYMFDPPDPEAGPPPPGAMHAWIEVYLPGAGWKGLDPTHGIFCHEAFIPVAHAAQADTVNPTQGGYYSPFIVGNRMTAQVDIEHLDAKEEPAPATGAGSA